MNILTKDKYNKDILLDSTQKHQIMMEWEKPYMEACIQKLQPFGDVLEVGFGLGYSATEIQKFPINSYTVIECDEETYKRALKWKEKYNHQINVILGKWEEVYQKLSQFDCIFFDDFDLKTLELCKVNSSVPCRNIDFIKKLKNKLKKYSRFSFYCATNENSIEQYKNQWENDLKRYSIKINFQKYEAKVPKICKYIIDQSLYCPLIEIKQVFKYE